AVEHGTKQLILNRGDRIDVFNVIGGKLQLILRYPFPDLVHSVLMVPPRPRGSGRTLSLSANDLPVLLAVTAKFHIVGLAPDRDGCQQLFNIPISRANMELAQAGFTMAYLPIDDIVVLSVLDGRVLAMGGGDIRSAKPRLLPLDPFPYLPAVLCMQAGTYSDGPTPRDCLCVLYRDSEGEVWLQSWGVRLTSTYGLTKAQGPYASPLSLPSDMRLLGRMSGGLPSRERERERDGEGDREPCEDLTVVIGDRSVILPGTSLTPPLPSPLSTDLPSGAVPVDVVSVDAPPGLSPSVSRTSQTGGSCMVLQADGVLSLLSLQVSRAKGPHLACCHLSTLGVPKCLVVLETPDTHTGAGTERERETSLFVGSVASSSHILSLSPSTGVSTSTRSKGKARPPPPPRATATSTYCLPSLAPISGMVRLPKPVANNSGKGMRDSVVRRPAVVVASGVDASGCLSLVETGQGTTPLGRSALPALLDMCAMCDAGGENRYTLVRTVRCPSLLTLLGVDGDTDTATPSLCPVPGLDRVEAQGYVAALPLRVGSVFCLCVVCVGSVSLYTLPGASDTTPQGTQVMHVQCACPVTCAAAAGDCLVLSDQEGRVTLYRVHAPHSGLGIDTNGIDTDTHAHAQGMSLSVLASSAGVYPQVSALAVGPPRPGSSLPSIAVARVGSPVVRVLSLDTDTTGTVGTDTHTDTHAQVGQGGDADPSASEVVHRSVIPCHLWDTGKISTSPTSLVFSTLGGVDEYLVAGGMGMALAWPLSDTQTKGEREGEGEAEAEAETGATGDADMTHVADGDTASDSADMSDTDSVCTVLHTGGRADVCLVSSHQSMGVCDGSGVTGVTGPSQPDRPYPPMGLASRPRVTLEAEMLSLSLSPYTPTDASAVGKRRVSGGVSTTAPLSVFVSGRFPLTLSATPSARQGKGQGMLSVSTLLCSMADPATGIRQGMHTHTQEVRPGDQYQYQYRYGVPVQQAEAEAGTSDTDRIGMGVDMCCGVVVRVGGQSLPTLCMYKGAEGERHGDGERETQETGADMGCVSLEVLGTGRTTRITPVSVEGTPRRVLYSQTQDVLAVVSLTFSAGSEAPGQEESPECVNSIVSIIDASTMEMLHSIPLPLGHFATCMALDERPEGTLVIVGANREQTGTVRERGCLFVYRYVREGSPSITPTTTTTDEDGTIRIRLQQPSRRGTDRERERERERESGTDYDAEAEGDRDLCLDGLRGVCAIPLDRGVHSLAQLERDGRLVVGMSDAYEIVDIDRALALASTPLDPEDMDTQTHAHTQAGQGVGPGALVYVDGAKCRVYSQAGAVIITHALALGDTVVLSDIFKSASVYRYDPECEHSMLPVESLEFSNRWGTAVHMSSPSGPLLLADKDGNFVTFSLPSPHAIASESMADAFRDPSRRLKIQDTFHLASQVNAIVDCPLSGHMGLPSHQSQDAQDAHGVYSDGDSAPMVQGADPGEGEGEGEWAVVRHNAQRQREQTQGEAKAGDSCLIHSMARAFPSRPALSPASCPVLLAHQNGTLTTLSPLSQRGSYVLRAVKAQLRVLRGEPGQDVREGERECNKSSVQGGFEEWLDLPDPLRRRVCMAAGVSVEETLATILSVLQVAVRC
ncbi:hypothetical protein KIPB_004255, partial [Kipferlia bialata]